MLVKAKHTACTDKAPRVFEERWRLHGWKNGQESTDVKALGKNLPTHVKSWRKQVNDLMTLPTFFFFFLSHLSHLSHSSVTLAVPTQPSSSLMTLAPSLPTFKQPFPDINLHDAHRAKITQILNTEEMFS